MKLFPPNFALPNQPSNIRFMAKRILIIMLLALVVMPLSYVCASEKGTTQSEVKLVVQKNDTGNLVRPRSLFTSPVSAYYDESLQTLDISYSDDMEGEVFLYMNGILIGYSNEIGCSFDLPGSGEYSIEIVCESWIATGTLHI